MLANLNRYFQAALLFNVPDGLKRLSFQAGEGNLSVLAVFSRGPEEYEKDCVWSAVQEVLGHLIEEPECKVDLEVETIDRSVSDLPNLVFARYEAERY